MNCPNCGAPAEGKGKFCVNCGSPMPSVDQASEPAVEQLAVEEVITEQVTQQPAVEQPITQPPMPTESSSQQPTQPMPAAEQAAQATQPMPAAYQPMSPQPGSPMPQNPPKSSGKAIGALVCGIISIALSGTIIFGIILGVIAIVLGVSAAKQTGDGKAKAGKICGIIGTSLAVVALIFCIVTGFAVFNFIQENEDDFDYLYTYTSSSSAANSSSKSGIDSSSSKSTSSKSSSSKSTSSSSASSSSKSTSSSSSSASSSSASSGVYENARYGYSLKIPSGFDKLSEGANGDGASFDNQSLNMKVWVYGSNNIDGLTPDQLMETWWQGGPDTTKEVGDNYVLFTQTEGNLMHIYFAFVGSGSINTLEIVYPDSTSDFSQQLDAAEELVGGFEPGNISAAH